MYHGHKSYYEMSYRQLYCVYFRDFSLCSYGGNTIRDLFPQYNITIAEYIMAPLSGVYNLKLIDDYLDRIKMRSRGNNILGEVGGGVERGRGE